MKGKTLFVLVMVLGALSAFVYWGIQKPSEEKAEKEKVEKKVFKEVLVKNAEVVELTSETAKEGIVLKKRAGGEWFFEKPLADLADGGEIRSLLQAVENLSSEKVIDEKPSTVEPFGLTKPRLSVRFGIPTKAPVPTSSTSDKGKPGDATTSYEFYTVKLGDKNPDGSQSYAQTTLRPTVYLVGAGIDSYVSKAVDDLREKKVISIESESDISQVEIRKSSGEKLILEKGSDPVAAKWMIRHPFEKEASNREVDSFLTKITGLRASRFVEGKLGAYNLERPEVTLKISLKGDKYDKRDIRKQHVGRLELFLSRKAEKDKKKGKDAKPGAESVDNYYAYTTSSPVLYQVGKYQFDGLNATAATFIDKRIGSDLKLADVETVRVERGTEVREFKRVDVGDWRILKPIEADAETTGIERVLTVLKDMTVKDVLGVGKSAVKTNIPEKPLLTVVTTFKDKAEKPLVVRFGKTVGDGKMVTVATGKEETVYSIEATEIERLWPKLSELQRKRIFQVNADDENLLSVSVQTKKGKVEYMRQKPKDRFRLDVTPEGKKSHSLDNQEASVKLLLTKIGDIEIKEYLGGSEYTKVQKEAGLADPSMTISVKRKKDNKEDLLGLALGTIDAKKTGIYGRLLGREAYYLVDANRYEELKKQVETLLDQPKK